MAYGPRTAGDQHGLAAEWSVAERRMTGGHGRNAEACAGVKIGVPGQCYNLL